MNIVAEDADVGGLTHVFESHGFYLSETLLSFNYSIVFVSQVGIITKTLSYYKRQAIWTITCEKDISDLL